MKFLQSVRKHRPIVLPKNVLADMYARIWINSKYV